MGCEVALPILEKSSGDLYKKALSLMEKGEYKEAADIFAGLDDYSLSTRYYWECMEKYKVEEYDKAMALWDNNDVRAAYDIFASLDYEDSTEKATSILKEHPEYLSVGNYFYFGELEQDGNIENGSEPIEWLVLAIKNSKALVISKCILYSQNYTDSTDSVTWESSVIRESLYNLYLAAFENENRSRIELTTVKQDENSEGSGFDPGDETYDFLFLLSEKEAREYFSGNVSRIARATAYAKQNGCYTDVNLNAWWRLRTPGTEKGRYVDVNADGSIFTMGIVGNTSSSGIRPAMWIRME